MGVPHAQAANSIAGRKTASPTKAALSTRSSDEPVLRSAAIVGKEDRPPVDGHSASGDVGGRSHSEKIVTVSVGPESLLRNAIGHLRKSDDVQHTSETRVQHSVETVPRRAVIHKVDAVLHAKAAGSSESHNDNLRNVKRSRGSEVISATSDNVCSSVTVDPGHTSASQSELMDCVVNAEKLQPVISETADRDVVQTVDAATEPHLPSASEESYVVGEPCSTSTEPYVPTVSEQSDTAAEPCSVNTTSEEVDDAEMVVGVSDDGNRNDLVEGLVVSSVPEEPVLSAGADGEPCMADGKEPLTSGHTHLPEETLSSITSLSSAISFEAVSSVADSDPQVGCGSLPPEYMQSAGSGSLEAADSSDSVVDVGSPNVCSAGSPTTLSFSDVLSSLASCDLPQMGTDDTQQLPADTQVPSVIETDLRDKDDQFVDQDTDATVDEQWEPVGFTIGDSAITSSTFRRCSLDLSGRGVGLSRIAEESPAGLAAVAGDMEHQMQPDVPDIQQHDTSGEYLVILLFSRDGLDTNRAPIVATWAD